jgi:hypothetical protein
VSGERAAFRHLRWQLNDADQVVKHQDELLRILPQDLWNAVKTRQRDIENMTVRLRGAIKRIGRLPRHLLSGLLSMRQCGGAFGCVTGREYGCASHRDGGNAACTNGIPVRIDVADRKLLDGLAEEILLTEGMHSLSVKSAGACGSSPMRHEKHTARIIRMLPRAAQVLYERIGAGNLRLLGGDYSTTVVWELAEKSEGHARVTFDSAMAQVQPRNADLLEEYFRTKVYPAFVSDTGGG